MKTIPVGDFGKLISSNQNLVLLDVRTPMEFAEVHIPQAQNIPLDALHAGQLISELGLSEKQPVYLICRSGARAAKASDKFAREGFDNSIVVEGGTQAWIDEGLAVKRGHSTAISLERQIRIAAGTLVLFGAILGWTVHAGFFGLSAFVGAGLIFAGVTDFCGMGLLLARMPWNRVQ